MNEKINRCVWCRGDELYEKYHDEEWGVPLYSEQKLFELLTLEGTQAGLSWLTILKKRENYRRAFKQFDFKKVALYDDEKIQSLLLNKGIVRNQLKLRATVKNAEAFINIRDEFGKFSHYIWQFSEGKTIQNSWSCLEAVPTETELSKLISKDLKKRGFAFVGPTICYAFMQAIGMVNDHVTDCYRYSELRR